MFLIANSKALMGKYSLNEFKGAFFWYKANVPYHFFANDIQAPRFRQRSYFLKDEG